MKIKSTCDLKKYVKMNIKNRKIIKTVSNKIKTILSQ